MQYKVDCLLFGDSHWGENHNRSGFVYLLKCLHAICCQIEHTLQIKMKVEFEDTGGLRH